jgi:hypothetical protein
MALSVRALAPDAVEVDIPCEHVGWAPPNAESRNYGRSPQHQRDAALTAEHAVRTLQLAYGHPDDAPSPKSAP